MVTLHPKTDTIPNRFDGDRQQEPSNDSPLKYALNATIADLKGEDFINNNVGEALLSVLGSTKDALLGHELPAIERQLVTCAVLFEGCIWASITTDPNGEAYRSAQSLYNAVHSTLHAEKPAESLIDGLRETTDLTKYGPVVKAATWLFHESLASKSRKEYPTTSQELNSAPVEQSLKAILATLDSALVNLPAYAEGYDRVTTDELVIAAMGEYQNMLTNITTATIEGSTPGVQTDTVVALLTTLDILLEERIEYDTDPPYDLYSLLNYGQAGVNIDNEAGITYLLNSRLVCLRMDALRAEKSSREALPRIV